MMARLAFGVIDIVHLLTPPHGAPAAPQHPLHLMAGERTAINGKEGKKVVAGRPLLECQGAIHIGFGRLKLGIEEQLPAQTFVMEPHMDVRTVFAAAEHMGGTVHVDDSETALLHKCLKQITQWPHAAIVPNDPAYHRGHRSVALTFVPEGENIAISAALRPPQNIFGGHAWSCYRARTLFAAARMASAFSP
ncbi:hypothetical protein BMS3Bbin10_02121 [bacterium BMS3Bbin10]|nr:hypothetical protein BMS3Bbin10_02121 [bacterium BMS3Bbin10]